MKQLTFPEITSYFKKFQDAQAKLEEVENNKKKLEEIADLGKIEEIQVAVEARMGPKMCDNTEMQSNSQKNAFLEVLQDFRREMETSNKTQHSLYRQMKEKLSAQQKKVQEQFEAKRQQWSSQRTELKEYCHSIVTSQNEKQLMNRSDQISIHLQQNLLEMQHSFQIQLLQQQIKRRQMLEDLLLIAKL